MLIEAFYDEYEQSLSIDEIIDLYHTNHLCREKTRGIYRKAFPCGYANINSMTLFSGIENAHIRQEEVFPHYSSHDSSSLLYA